MNRRGFLTLFASGATPALFGIPARAQPATDIEEIKAAHLAVYKALSARDLDSMAALWSQKPAVTHIGPLSKTPMIGHREAVTDYFNTIFGV